MVGTTDSFTSSAKAPLFTNLLPVAMDVAKLLHHETTKSCYIIDIWGGGGNRFNIKKGSRVPVEFHFESQTSMGFCWERKSGNHRQHRDFEVFDQGLPRSLLRPKLLPDFRVKGGGWRKTLVSTVKLEEEGEGEEEVNLTLNAGRAIEETT